MDNTTIYICKNIEENIPTEIQVIPYGRYDTPKGEFVLDDDGAAGIVAAFEAQKNDMVIDYEHQTLAGTEAPAAGWIKKLINKGKDGIWASVEWTERAKKYLLNREYRYLSPVFVKRIADNKVIKLINVALTNQPNIDGMVPVANKQNPENGEEKKEVVTMKALLKLLGLAESATEEEAIVAVNKLMADVKALEEKTAIVANKSVLDALGLKDGATEAEITGTIMAMKQSHGTVEQLTSELTAIKNKLTEKEATEAIEKAMQEGKITPAQKDWAMEYAKRDMAGFHVFVSKAPVIVPVGQKVSPDKKEGDGQLDETQLFINKLCGVDTETFKKYSVKEA